MQGCTERQSRAGATVPGCSLGSGICLAFSTHPSRYSGLALHPPHTCSQSPLWICLKLLLLQGWDVLEPPKSTSAPSSTTPIEVPGAPEPGVQSHIHHGHWAVSTTKRPLKGLNPEWIYPRGTLLCFYAFNSLDFLSAA